MALGLLTAVGRVAPVEALERADAVGRIRQRAGAEAVRVTFIDLRAVGAAHTEFICVALLGIFGKGLPNAVFQIGHRQILGIPEIPVSGDADALCMRRPHAEEIAVLSVALRAVAAERGVGVQLVSGRKLAQDVVQGRIHVVRYPQSSFLSSTLLYHFAQKMQPLDASFLQLCCLFLRERFFRRFLQIFPAIFGRFSKSYVQTCRISSAMP